jgi:hypothetical protein
MEDIWTLPAHFTADEREHLLASIAHQMFRRELDVCLAPLHRMADLFRKPPLLMVGADGKYHDFEQEPSDEELKIRAHIQTLTLQLAESYGLRPYPHCTTPEQPANPL